MKLASAVVLATLASGCAKAHLGPSYGRAVRTAFEAQAQRTTPGPAPLDAHDANIILSKHRTGAVPAAASVSPIPVVGAISTSPSSLSPTGGTSSTGGLSNPNPIRLEAK
ncbi:MAG: hypothetical protein HY698_02360 [Deltaproteobacteria bacterium]|nr:hypothetical protein [Deltaproteobacteria bacterium]